MLQFCFLFQLQQKMLQQKSVFGRILDAKYSNTLHIIDRKELSVHPLIQFVIHCSGGKLIGLVQERSILLRRWYNIIMDNKEELAKLITLEMVQYIFIYLFCHFRLHQAICQITVSHGSAHCCKGDAASQWKMAILGESELRNPEPID